MSRVSFLPRFHIPRRSCRGLEQTLRVCTAASWSAGHGPWTVRAQSNPQVTFSSQKPSPVPEYPQGTGSRTPTEPPQRPGSGPGAEWRRPTCGQAPRPASALGRPPAPVPPLPFPRQVPRPASALDRQPQRAHRSSLRSFPFIGSVMSAARSLLSNPVSDSVPPLFPKKARLLRRLRALAGERGQCRP